MLYIVVVYMRLVVGITAPTLGCECQPGSQRGHNRLTIGVPTAITSPPPSHPRVPPLPVRGVNEKISTLSGLDIPEREKVKNYASRKTLLLIASLLDVKLPHVLTYKGFRFL